MNVFSTVYLTVFLYLFLQYIWQYFCMYFQQYFLLYFSCTFTTVTVPSRLLRVGLRRRAVSANFAARSLRQFVARQRKRRQTAEFNQIRSARLNSGVQRQLVQARLGCALMCHSNLGWRSITRWQRSSDVQVTLKWWVVYRIDDHCRESDLGFFLKQLHIEIQAQKINANGYNVTEMIWEWHGIAAIAYCKERNKWLIPYASSTEAKIATPDKAPSSKLWNIPVFWNNRRESTFIE